MKEDIKLFMENYASTWQDELPIFIPSSKETLEPSQVFKKKSRRVLPKK